jgi:hypothetical protein
VIVVAEPGQAAADLAAGLLGYPTVAASCAHGHTWSPDACDNSTVPLWRYGLAAPGAAAAELLRYSCLATCCPAGRTPPRSSARRCWLRPG